MSNTVRPIIRVTKEFGFEMAHLLTEYDGLCRNIHGHSYKLAVTVCGRACDDPSSPKLGMVIDFSVLKGIVNEEIVGRLDHALMVRADTPQARRLEGVAERIVLVDYQPTCAARLPEGVTLHAVRLHETATSFAEWVAADNDSLL